MDSAKSMAQAASAAAPEIANADKETRNEALLKMAEGLETGMSQLLEANALDVAHTTENGASAHFIDRVRLTEERVRQMANAIREVVALPSPLGRVEEMRERPNGLKVGRMRIPIGVIAIIYEARPNVTSDAASLCLKSGNVVLLKGGRDAQHSNRAIASVLRQALGACGLPEDGIQLISSSDRNFLSSLLQQEEEIDLVIPRGGEGLIRFVSEHSRIPVLKHYKGVCHVYLTASADPVMAVDICENAKVQRPSVCNAMETLLVDRGGAQRLLPLVGERLKQRGVLMRGCEETREILASCDIPVERATDADYSAEYLALELAIKIVSGLDEAAAHIRRFGSDHTESIITEDEVLANAFVQRVNSSCVMVNASTRFADGGELGLGAEIGISTTKLHSYGPMGLEDLTARKFVVLGTGQVRE